jgi:hypothetical protein
MIKNMVSMVNALAKLHNFCIDCEDGSNDIAESTPEDLSYIMNSDVGYVSMENVEGSEVELPLQIMGGGHHFDNVPRNLRQDCCQGGIHTDNIMPRDKLLRIVTDSNTTWPPVRCRK